MRSLVMWEASIRWCECSNQPLPIPSQSPPTTSSSLGFFCSVESSAMHIRMHTHYIPSIPDRLVRTSTPDIRRARMENLLSRSSNPRTDNLKADGLILFLGLHLVSIFTSSMHMRPPFLRMQFVIVYLRMAGRKLCVWKSKYTWKQPHLAAVAVQRNHQDTGELFILAKQPEVTALHVVMTGKYSHNHSKLQSCSS